MRDRWFEAVSLQRGAVPNRTFLSQSAGEARTRRPLWPKSSMAPEGKVSFRFMQGVKMGRDGRLNRRQAYVPVARGRSRRGASRNPGSAPTGQMRSRQAHAQAAPQAGLRAEDSND